MSSRASTMTDAGRAVRVSAFVMVALGAVILVMWSVFLGTGVMDDGIRTVENGQYLVFHIAAECIMGIVLVAGGVALLRGMRWALPVALAGLGMTIYSTINSLAHSVRNDPALTPVLLISFVIAMAISVTLVKDQLNTGRKSRYEREHSAGRIRTSIEDEPAGETG